jgi:hypothetical protein
MPQEIKKEDLQKELDDVKSLMSHLEEEYRKANVSEKYYQELKGKYFQKMETIEKKLGAKKEKTSKKEKPKVEEIKEEVVEEKTEIKETKEEKPKVGFLGKLFGKKEEKPQEAKPEETSKKEEKPKEDKEKEKEIEVGEIEEMTPEVIEKLAQQVAEQSGVTGTETPVEEAVEEVSEEQPESKSDVEIEKLKVMIDNIRDAKRATDETIQTLSEGIGEIRSMIFQTDASLRETGLKLEKIEDDISEVKPKEIDKKFRDITSTLDKQQMLFEKFDKKSEDLAEKINKVYDILKEIGGIENLVNLNKDIQKKIEDVKEALKYTERIAFKTEKIFIDLNRNLEDFTIYKTRQENLDEIVKDLIKSVDGMNLKLESFPVKRDLEIINADILTVKKQIEEINKVLPVVQAKLPETITNLRRQKEDILLFLDFLNQQFKSGSISIGEYELSKKENQSRLSKVENELKDEWERIKDVVLKSETTKEVKPAEEEVLEEKPPKEEKVEEVKPAEVEKPKTEETKEVKEEETPKAEKVTEKAVEPPKIEEPKIETPPEKPPSEEKVEKTELKAEVALEEKPVEVPKIEEVKPVEAPEIKLAEVEKPKIEEVKVEVAEAAELPKAPELKEEIKPEVEQEIPLQKEIIEEESPIQEEVKPKKERRPKVKKTEAPKVEAPLEEKEEEETAEEEPETEETEEELVEEKPEEPVTAEKPVIKELPKLTEEKTSGAEIPKGTFLSKLRKLFRL